jgi:hypothetical protein
MNGITILETTVPHHSNDILNSLMLNYLKKCFPVKRIKSKKDKSFKRAIIIYSNETYFISNGIEIIKLRMIDILLNIFDCDKENANIVVNNYFI